LGGGREGGRVKIQLLMKAVGGGEASEHLWRGFAVLSFFGALHQCATRAFSFCRHLFSYGIYVPLFLASRMLPCLALPCPSLHCTSLVRFVARSAHNNPLRVAIDSTPQQALLSAERASWTSWFSFLGADQPECSQG
jgi:hypothetical protein